MKQETKFIFTESDILQILQEYVETYYQHPKGETLTPTYKIKSEGNHDMNTFTQKLESLTLTVVQTIDKKQ